MKNKIKLIRLILQFSKRDFNQKYVGTGLGQLWFFISPILMISIYTIIFSDIMQLKLSFDKNNFSYSTYLIPGILAWTSFSTIISSLSSSFEKKANLIKKINVPMYIFQLSLFVTEFTVFLISISLAIIFLLITSVPVTTTFLWMLPVMLLQTIFAFSIGVIFSLFTPFFKDLKVVIPITMKLWFWTTPIVYMKELIMAKFPAVLIYNPFFYFIDIYHDIFIYSKAPSMTSLITVSSIAIISLFTAAFLYKKMVSTVKDII